MVSINPEDSEKNRELWLFYIGYLFLHINIVRMRQEANPLIAEH